MTPLLVGVPPKASLRKETPHVWGLCKQGMGVQLHALMPEEGLQSVALARKHVDILKGNFPFGDVTAEKIVGALFTRQGAEQALGFLLIGLISYPDIGIGINRPGIISVQQNLGFN